MGNFHGACDGVPEFITTHTIWVAYKLDKGGTVAQLLGTARFSMMYVCTAVEGAEVGDIWHSAKEGFMQGDTTICRCGGTVQAVDGSGSGFTPEGKWAVLVLEECTDAFCQGTVHLFSNTILLGGMGYGELKQDSMLRTVVMKVLIYILTAIVSA